MLTHKNSLIQLFVRLTPGKQRFDWRTLLAQRMVAGMSTRENLSLFPSSEAAASAPQSPIEHRPLADRLRPTRWEEFAQLESFDQSLIAQLRTGAGRAPSLILWGPPGCGKTTFARLIGTTFRIPFVEFSAVLGGVKEVREIVDEAKRGGRGTILFVDEIHRFNKAQQDAFLPHVENGTITLIGATTENPSFALTGALLSRTRVLVFPVLAERGLEAIVRRGEHALGMVLADDARDLLVSVAGGDARKVLTLLEGFVNAHPQAGGDRETLRGYLEQSHGVVYDRSGEQHYNMVSAFIKSMRGSDPDAALYWAFRMLEGGEDPRFILRRMMIFASEDIGNADPRALLLATATADAFERLGLPEGRIPIAHCITYLATAPKSNRSYVAMKEVVAAIQRDPQVEVPLHLRNAPTTLMKELGYGAAYQYPHDDDRGFIRGVQYLPDSLATTTFYEPSEHGYEKTILERMRVRRAG